MELADVAAAAIKREIYNGPEDEEVVVIDDYGDEYWITDIHRGDDGVVIKVMKKG